MRACVFLYLSMKAWCSRNMGSLAEPCTEDMEPFMKTCRALCMVLWPGTASPVMGLAKPGGETESEKHEVRKGWGRLRLNWQSMSWVENWDIDMFRRKQTTSIEKLKSPPGWKVCWCIVALEWCRHPTVTFYKWKSNHSVVYKSKIGQVLVTCIFWVSVSWVYMFLSASHCLLVYVGLMDLCQLLF